MRTQTKPAQEQKMPMDVALSVSKAQESLSDLLDRKFFFLTKRGKPQLRTVARIVVRAKGVTLYDPNGNLIEGDLYLSLESAYEVWESRKRAALEKKLASAKPTARRREDKR